MIFQDILNIKHTMKIRLSPKQDIMIFQKIRNIRNIPKIRFRMIFQDIRNLRNTLKVRPIPKLRHSMSFRMFVIKGISIKLDLSAPLPKKDPQNMT